MDQTNSIIFKNNKTNNNVSISQIQDIVFNILKEIDRVLRKNSIGYALAFGTALGLKEFNDFIPWDDDADIAIDYFDIPKVIEAFKKDLGRDFVFDCYETDKKYNVLIPTMKVRYKHSKIKEKTNLFIPNRCNNGDGIFVDIVAFMGVPQNINKHKRLFIKSKIMMPIMCFLDGICHINPKRMKESLKKYESKVASKYQNSDYVSQTIIIPFQELPLTMVKHLSFHKNVVYPFKDYEFRGYKFLSFNDVNEFCKLRYGEFKKPSKISNDHIINVDIYK